MNNTDLPKGRIILAEQYTHRVHLAKLLENTEFLAGISLISFDSWLHQYADPKKNRTQFWCTVAKIIAENRNSLAVLNSSAGFPAFIDEIVTFIEMMADLDLVPSDLPSSQLKDDDIKKLITEISRFESPRAALIRQMKRSYDSTDFSALTFMPNYRSPEQQKLINDFIDRGSRSIELPQIKSTNTEFYYAVNPRSEAQAVAQRIALESIPLKNQLIVCLDSSSVIEPLTYFLNQYKIPYTLINDRENLSVPYYMNTLLDFTDSPTADNWLRILKCGCFGSTLLLDLVEYAESFSIELKTHLKPFTHVEKAMVDTILWDPARVTTYSKMETKAEQIRFKLQPVLEKLVALSILPWQKRVEGCFYLLSEVLDLEEPLNVEGMLKIQEVLENSLPILTTLNEPTPYLQFLLDKITIQAERTDGILIGDLRHFHVPDLKQVYILGCTQKNYPQFTTHGGLFDETYLSQLKSYDLSERYTLHMKQVSEVFSIAPSMIFSYPIGNYEGKSNDLSFEIEQLLRESGVYPAKPWAMRESSTHRVHTPELAPEYAQRLFFKEGQLVGSVSSFERFFGCPYKYFLTTGLKLSTPPKALIETSLMGILQHALLETTVNEFGKDYASQAKNTLQSRIDPYFDDLCRLYPVEKARIESIRRRTVLQLDLALDFLAAMEADTLFTPIATEKKFGTVLPVPSIVPVYINGSIDRVDTTADSFRIIDYKSSAKSLNELKIQSGQQLQLPTYLWMGEKLFEKKPMGAYYYSLKQVDTPVSALSFSLAKTELTELDRQEWKLSRLKNHRLKGWTFGDPTTLDFHGNYISSLSVKENKVKVLTQSAYDFELIKEALNQLYADLAKRLSEGDISKSCLEHACDYCDYANFCQFRGDPLKAFNRTTVLKLKGGAPDGME